MKPASNRIEFLQGTLDVLILRTLQSGPRHGHAISKHIRHASGELFQVETGSLYPALHRLEARGWVSASWQQSELGKRARYYRLTSAGRKQLRIERSKWEQFAETMSRVLDFADSEPV